MVFQPYASYTVAYRGGGGFRGFKPTPNEIPKALQNRARTQPDCENC